MHYLCPWKMSQLRKTLITSCFLMIYNASNKSEWFFCDKASYIIPRGSQLNNKTWHWVYCTNSSWAWSWKVLSFSSFPPPTPMTLSGRWRYWAPNNLHLIFSDNFSRCLSASFYSVPGFECRIISCLQH